MKAILNLFSIQRLKAVVAVIAAIAIAISAVPASALAIVPAEVSTSQPTNSVQSTAMQKQKTKVEKTLGKGCPPNCRGFGDRIIKGGGGIEHPDGIDSARPNTSILKSRSLDSSNGSTFDRSNLKVPANQLMNR